MLDLGWKRVDVLAVQAGEGLCEEEAPAGAEECPLSSAALARTCAWEARHLPTFVKILSKACQILTTVHICLHSSSLKNRNA